MTRAEAYAEGFSEGRRWAEEDIRARGPMDETEAEIRDNARAVSDLPIYARGLGLARGYRDTRARWDDGRLTWEMLEHAPVNR